MKIGVGCDHAGLEAKSQVLEAVRAAGHEPVDVGTHSAESVDYPDFARTVAEGVAAGKFDRGILVCGSGVGMSIMANKVAGVRAALCWSPEIAKLSRLHNDANVLCLPGRFLERGQIVTIARCWLETAFEGGRHERRIAKIAAYEHPPKAC